MRRMLLCLVALAASSLAEAQAQTVAPAVARARPTGLTVQRVHCDHPHAGPRDGTAQAASDTAPMPPCSLGRRLHVHFANLAEWMQTDPGHDPRQLRLALNGYELAGIPPTAPVFGHDTLSFDLRHADDNTPEADTLRQTWRTILRGHRARQALTVSVGLKNTPPFFGSQAVLFEFLPPYGLAVFAGLGGLVLVLVWLAGHSDLLRSPGPDPGGGPRRPYDLGRFQMACWLVVVLSSYLYIWLITGNRDSLTSGTLILLGISVATGLGSVLVDASKPTAGTAPQAPEPPAGAPGSLPAPPVQPSQGFLRDILSDTQGVSLYRFQMAAWMLVLNVVFRQEVFTDLAMPDFSPTLLGLLGISAGTYVGFKIPEPPRA